MIRHRATEKIRKGSYETWRSRAIDVGDASGSFWWVGDTVGVSPPLQAKEPAWRAGSFNLMDSSLRGATEWRRSNLMELGARLLRSSHSLRSGTMCGARNDEVGASALSIN